MRRVLILPLIVIICITLLFSGCNKAQKSSIDDQIAVNDEKDSDNINSDNINDEIIDNETESIEVVEQKIEGIPSPLSGIIAPEEKVNRRVVAIMFDNHPKARWQAGLSQAEVVYEFLVEAPYTRYLGLFLINDPEMVGPIRSARPYFVTTALENDAVYVRVGGSEQAKEDVKKLKIADIDGMSSSSDVFWRYYKTGKKAPNNMYSSMEAIRKTQEERGYRLTTDLKYFNFNREDTDINGENAEEITIRYNHENTTKYVYDKDKKLYKRYKDGKEHIDENDNKTLYAKNIIIQEAKTRVIDSEGRLDIELIGKGKGMYITNGKAQNITWIKESRSDKTKYYDEQGDEINLNPGITWIQVTRLNPNLEIK